MALFLWEKSLGHINVEAALEDLISAVKDAPLVNIPGEEFVNT